MACCKPNFVILQMALLVAAGAALGLWDQSRRPVMVVPPEIEALPTSTAPKPAPATTPGETTPAKPVTPPPSTPATEPTTPSTQTPAQTPSQTPAEPVAAPAGERIDPALVKEGHITVAQAWELYNAAPPAIFIDSRHAPEYEAGHVAGAFRLPLDAFKGQEPAHIQFMPRSDTYIVYCVGGNCDESTAVQKQLLLAGYRKVYVMHAGYPGWVDAGHPTEVGQDPIEANEGRP